MDITLREAIEDAHRGVKRMIHCPVHGDNTPSLSVAPGIEQPVVLNCFASCDPEEILAAEGMEWKDISRPEDPTKSEGISTFKGTASHCYPYCDAEGTEVYQVLRVPQPDGKKTFLQRHHDGEKWVWNLQGVQPTLYRLPEILSAVEKGRTVYYVEGEKDVETLRFYGHTATCNPMGAGKWRPEYAKHLEGADVVVIADADEPGRKHARTVADALSEAGCTVKGVESMLGKDVTDHFAKGGTVETLTQVWSNQQEEIPSYGLGIQDFLAQELPPDVEVIPGMLAQAEVCIVVGWEGQGKSELLRQIAVTTAAGLHPFTGMPIEPKRVLYIDSENPETQTLTSWANLAGLAARHTGKELDNDMLTILSEWRNEPDLTSVAGQAWLYERIQAYQPDLVLAGPVQNLCARDVKDDEVVRKLKHAVNQARSICGSAFILEHHAPHRAGGDSERPVRPYGSSLFLKWPDHGYGLKPVKDREGVFDLVANRRPRVRNRRWPEQIQVGEPNTLHWPWEEAEPAVGGSITYGAFGK